MSMRADFEAAFEDSDLPNEPTSQEVLDEDISESADTSTDEDAGTPASESEDESAGESTTDTIAEPAIDSDIAASEGTEGIAAPDESETSVKAPIDWTPKQREDWSKIPRHLQEKVISREKEMATTMQETAVARQTHQQMSQLAQTYGSVLGAEGYKNPMDAVAGTFQAISQLRMGSEASKAQAMAGLIQHYGIDINALDSALVGSAPDQSSQQNQQLEQMLEQRMAPVNQYMQQQAQQQQQQAQQQKQQADNAVIGFSENAEFINDVRGDMADLMDMAAKHGTSLTLQQAYDKACAIHPEISQVVQQRQQQQQLMGNNKALAGKRAAASSISGRKGGLPAANANMSMRDQISASWDNLAQG